ncbi:MAG: hypothetical protein ACOYL8_03080 [Patescibacteria group bacterium]
MNYFAECLARFQALPEASKEAFGGAEVYLAIKELEDKYKIQLSFLVILIAINELEEKDVEEYLVLKFKLKPVKAKEVKEKFNTIIDRVIEKLIQVDTVNAGRSNKLTVGKEELVTLFSKRIIETLKIDADTILSLNAFIFKSFDNDHELGERIVNILYSNTELVTSARLVSEEKEVSPTVSNWIKDFIRVNGSGMFDELVLAQYLSTSQNAKTLSAVEKDLLRKVLKLYRNLVYYPESMEGFAPEDWQIIPYDRSQIKIHEFQDILGDLPIENKVENKIEDSNFLKDSLEENPLNELQEALPNYAPGSLEHKAVTQEIGRLKNKK